MKRSETPFTRDEISRINKALTSAKTPRALRVEDCPDEPDEDACVIEYFGCFTNVEFKMSDPPVGIKFTFTCNAPYGFSTETASYLTGDNPDDFILVNSDEAEEYIYPSYTVQTDAPGSVTICNHTDGHEVSYLLDGNSTYHFDSFLCVAGKEGEEITLEDIGFTDDVTDIYWLRLLDGENHISVDGSIRSVVIKYRTPKKVGEV